jgi:hypothetical protein
MPLQLLSSIKKNLFFFEDGLSVGKNFEVERRLKSYISTHNLGTEKNWEKANQNMK